MANWHRKYIEKKPWARIPIQRNNNSWIVREIDSELEVLDLHSTLTPINLKTIIDNPNKLAGYYPYQPSKDANLVLGFFDEANIQFLQNIVSQKYPTLFQMYAKTIKVFQKETTLNNALKQPQGKLLKPDCIQALMTKLTSIGIPSAALYASSFETKICEEKIFEEIAMEFLKILYIIPEKIEKNNQFKIFLNHLYNQKKLRLVIDEAHCILNYNIFAWSKLGSLKLNYPEVPLLLLTATASSANINAIQKNLNIKDENFEIVKSVDMVRHEISYKVINKKDKKDTVIAEMAEMIEKIVEGKIIIYCARRQDYNKIQVIIATIAFGMGLDTSDVRLVLHHTFPMSLIELIQLSGRAGRDGKQAQDVIFFSMRDLRTNYCIITGNQE
ncbi:22426_t:CDS:2, partial [Gigaspora rosea]